MRYQPPTGQENSALRVSEGTTSWYEPTIGQSNYALRVLPARAGYLIRGGDEEGLVRAIQEASTRWAGFSEPVIPLSDSGTVDGLCRETLELSNVDGLVNVNVDPSVAGPIGEALGIIISG